MGRDPLGGAGVTAQLELHLAGVFGVVRDGVPLADGGLRSRKARTLLKLLTVERARLVSVDRIAEVLWAGDPPAEPAQHVATLVSRLRRALGPDAIRGGRQGYQLAGDPGIVVDLDEAARLTSHAERELEWHRRWHARRPGVRSSCCRRESRWPRNRTLRGPSPLGRNCVGCCAVPGTPWRGLRRRLALPDLAARVAGDAMADDPFDESAHRLFMSACAAAGERARALETYARLRSRLAEELGADPAPDTNDLYLAILRQHSPGDPGQRDGSLAQPAVRRTGSRHPTRGLDSAAASRGLVGRDREVGELTAAWAEGYWW